MTIYYNFLLSLSLLTFYGAVTYRVYQLNYFGIFFSLILTIITFILLKKHKNSNNLNNHGRYKLNIKDIGFFNILMIASYYLLIIINFVILFKVSTTESIISPWQVAPWYFFVIYTLATTVLMLIILRLKSDVLRLFLISTHFFFSFSVALLVYAVGYGFDPFIHEATEKLIAQNGFVNPKPFYYLGQYSIIIILHKILFIPISILNTWLVPVLASIFLPPALFYAVKKIISENKIALFATLFILIFPFSTFIISTPQNLANLFLILIILISLISQEKIHNFKFIILNSLALATLAIHPVSGIPAIFFITMLWIKEKIINKKLIAYGLGLIAIESALALPLAFYLNNKTSAVINYTSSTANNINWQLPELFLSGQENFLLNFVYLYGFNISIIILLLILSGFIIHTKLQKHKSYDLRLTAYGLMSLSILASYILTKFINFSYLINYEQSAFSDRILQIAILFTLPFILIALSELIKQILKQEKIIKYSLICFFVFLLSFSLYHSYPRFDDYYNSRSFSTSQSDINAVRWIEADAKNTNYIVLANQQVSVAALREFGFKKYFQTENGEVFYYPIPTGEQLYQYYLDMVYKNADKKTAMEAANLVNVNIVYFVLNDYWWAFDKILNEAKLEADEVKNIDNGKIYIFKYKK